MQFDTFKLATVLDELLNAPIKYQMKGNIGKVRPLSTDVSNIKKLDCSGFVEYVIYKATTNNLNISSGSSNQRDDISNDASHSVATYDTDAKLSDDIVRIGFRKTIIAKDSDGKIVRKENGKPKKSQVGHVWLVINGQTYESTSRRPKTRGPKSLLWSERKDDADHFYKLGAAPGFGLAMLGIRTAMRISALA
ncbi:hypothetical protein [Sulfitobacter mediterraneus]|uniref:Uncharacterized protein n=1 Tax=Sulfitobacter mediterraneus TaxID=83219 RepID=A0A2T6C2P8_9RHOB|nr:hypothetical protein [Sulfitobacter mediterraneus]KIN77938.1 hypothetical protein Z950_590 [Sulfitobacter mediterraneus KCTC 32188]PTX62602.1 hypothetical protein C8N31_11822 [Sulfitobacter mediterraneus]